MLILNVDFETILGLGLVGTLIAVILLAAVVGIHMVLEVSILLPNIITEVTGKFFYQMGVLNNKIIFVFNQSLLHLHCFEAEVSDPDSGIQINFNF